MLRFIDTQQWLSGFGGTGLTHLALREPDKLYFADPACKRRRILPYLQFPLHQSFCRPSIHWFYVTLSEPDVKEAGNAMEKDGTHLHLQLHTKICLQKKRENDDCL